MAPPALHYSTEAQPEAHEFVTQQLIAFNRAASPRLDTWYQPENDAVKDIDVYARDEQGQVMEGFLGYVQWGWLEVDIVWVDQRLRGRDVGQHLMALGEQRGRDLGATHAKLSTFDVQAKPFYEKLGYRVYGELPNYPLGHTMFFMQKALV